MCWEEKARENLVAYLAGGAEEAPGRSNIDRVSVQTDGSVKWIQPGLYSDTEQWKAGRRWSMIQKTWSSLRISKMVTSIWVEMQTAHNVKTR